MDLLFNTMCLRSALANEKETFAIYKSQLGDEHDKTKESGKFGFKFSYVSVIFCF